MKIYKLTPISQDIVKANDKGVIHADFYGAYIPSLTVTFLPNTALGNSFPYPALRF